MPRPKNQTQIITIDDNNILKGIMLNYSESFNRVIELSIENYTEWKTNILYLLCINNLDSYVTKEKIKKRRKKDINDNLDKYIQNKFDETLVYEKKVSNEDIKKTS